MSATRAEEEEEMAEKHEVQKSWMTERLAPLRATHKCVKKTTEAVNAIFTFIMTLHVCVL
jgi:hypothetical protein